MSAASVSESLWSETLRLVEDVDQQTDEADLMATLTHELLATMQPAHAAHVRDELNAIVSNYPQRYD